MSSYESDNIERSREANEGLAYEEYIGRGPAADRVPVEDEEDERDVLDPSDPDHPDFYENAVSAYDRREGK